MSPALLHILSTLAFPLYLAQGLYVRQKSLRLSPPSEGPLEGQFGDGEAVHRLLVVGDSSAAGVGLDHTRETMGFQAAQKLHQRTGETVAWRMSGHNSAVAGEIRDLVVPNLAPEDYTHIFLMIGTNDIKNWHSAKRWKREFGGLLYALRTRFPGAKIYWHQAIDVRDTPMLPKMLGTIMNWRVQIFNRKGAQLCVERGAVAVPPLDSTNAWGYCRDGFHANKYGFSYWTDHMLDHIHHTPTSTPAARPHLPAPDERSFPYAEPPAKLKEELG
ncbi:MAG: SGNH/GDSL hydrolase family protein [Pseudomonadota bacterium]